METLYFVCLFVVVYYEKILDFFVEKLLRFFDRKYLVSLLYQKVSYRGLISLTFSLLNCILRFLFIIALFCLLFSVDLQNLQFFPKLSKLFTMGYNFLYNYALLVDTYISPRDERTKFEYSSTDTMIWWCYLSTIPGTKPLCLVNTEGNVNSLGTKSLV